MEGLHRHIRALREDDRSSLLFLAEEVLRPLAEASGHPDRYQSDDLLDLVERADVYVAVTGEADGEIAGFVAVEDEAGDLLVRCLCVGPAFEAQRVGHQLLDWAEGLAYSRGLGHMRVHVPAGDRASQRLYEGHSFVPRPAADRPEVIVMDKRLLG
jgi:GNAT superfamily N-acetyltransferase